MLKTFHNPHIVSTSSTSSDSDPSSLSRSKRKQDEQSEDFFFRAFDGNFDDDNYSVMSNSIDNMHIIDDSLSSGHQSWDSSQFDEHNNETMCDSSSKKTKAKRKPPPYKLLPVAPRLLKNDIRRQYARMYCNVINSYDLDLIMSFFSTFSAQSISMKNNIRPHESAQNAFTNINQLNTDNQVCTVNNTNYRPRKCEMEIEGKDIIAFFLLATRQLSPDCVTHLHNTVVKTRSDTDDTELQCEMSFEGSLLYDIPVENMISKAISVSAALRNAEDFKRQDQNNEECDDKRSKRSRRLPSSSIFNNDNSDAVSSRAQVSYDSGERNPGLLSSSLISLPEGDKLDAMAFVKSHFDPCSTYRNADGQVAEMLPKPARMGVHGTVSFIIDSNKRIKSINYIATDKHASTG